MLTTPYRQQKFTPLFATSTATSTALVPFTHDQFGQIRIIKDEATGEPWFVATDVCNILSLTNPTVAMQRLDDDERTKCNLGRQGFTNCVNESGLYSLILISRKPEAKAFSRWVRHEVLPSVRKHGGYLTPSKVEEAPLNPDTLIQLAMNLKDERAKVSH